MSWYPRDRKLLIDLENGAVSLLDIAVHDVLSFWADFKTGVCWASAEKIHALCPAHFSAKTIQRSLEKLDRIGWIKRWMIRGRKGNYPVLICGYYVRQESMTWVQTSGLKTIDWKDVQFDAVHDVSFNRPRAVRETVHEYGSEVSTVQEGRPVETQIVDKIQNQSQKPAAKPASDQSLRTEHEQRRIVNARDSRKAREEEVRREAAVGTGPQPEGPAISPEGLRRHLERIKKAAGGRT